ncbi:MAG: hypothetical protein IPJ74_06955 [Saprospiraceae bacterium]|nr:hypothetical protein [Saprospiraceae bacterium]
MEVTKKKTKSKSETGHMKNLMNFEDLKARLIALGGRYNPSRPELQINQLEQLHQEAQMVFDRLTTASTFYDAATNARADLFEKLGPMATSIVNTFIASGVSAKTVEDAKGFQRKIQGTRLKGKDTDANIDSTEANAEEPATNGTENGETTEDKSRSSARLSYDLKIDHFAKLASLAQNELLYQPYEPELQVGALLDFLQQLRTASTNKTYADTEIEAARSERKRVFYHPENGLVARALQAKAYVKAVLGTKNEDFKHIRRIKFRMID